jgi:hypothetical protein
MITAPNMIKNKNLLVGYPNRGVSNEARKLEEAENNMQEEIFTSFTLSEPDYRVKLALIDAFIECSSDNWDSYGAKAVNFDNYLAAWKFWRTLPTTVPIPEISVDPDGEFILEWHNGPRKVFSVIVERGHQLTYAGLFGDNKVYGNEYFEYELPPMILFNLRRALTETS